MKNALILYPNQLFPLDKFPDVDTVFMVEEPLFFGSDIDKSLKLHKQKLILLRAASQRYVEEVLWPASIKVEYVDLDVLFRTEDILERTKNFEQVYLFDPIDNNITVRLLEARRNRDDLPPLEFLPSPNFYLSEEEVRDYFQQRHKHVFDEFYQWQRERFNVFIGNDYKPLGGSWQLDAGTSTREDTLPSFAVFGDNNYVQNAVEWVESRFGDNPGSTDFVWPTSHGEAAAWLEDFVAKRLPGFGANYHRIDSDAMWLYHSALSSSLNIGLLSPQQVVDAVVGRATKNPQDLASAELMVRLVLGEREFSRGLYVAKYDELKKDAYKNTRRLSASWYTGNLGLPPYDNAVKKLQSKGYIHSVEGAVVVAGLMTLSDINRADITNFFLQMMVDAYEWSVLPSIYRSEQLISDDFSDLPPVQPSDFIIGISNYQHGLWADTWDGLYWRFVEKHHKVLANHAITKLAVKELAQLDTDRKRIISYRAEDFLKQYTN